MSMSPKDLLKQAAQAVDNVNMTLAKPLLDLAQSAGLPAVEPPRLADMVDSLPDLPAPQELAAQLPLPQPPQPQPRTTVVVRKADSVTRMPSENRVETRLKLRIL